MSRKTGHHVYVVAWPDALIVKAGYTEYQRWQVFTYRGAEIVSLTLFEDFDEAFAYEAALYAFLRGVGTLAFESREESKPFLGGGGGYLECFRLPTLGMLQALPQAMPRAMLGSSPSNAHTYRQTYRQGSYVERRILQLSNAREHRPIHRDIHTWGQAA
jgi:hypothetical protein